METLALWLVFSVKLIILVDSVAGSVPVERQSQGERSAAPKVLKPRPKNMKKKPRDRDGSETNKSNVVMDHPSKDVVTQNTLSTGVSVGGPSQLHSDLLKHTTPSSNGIFSSKSPVQTTQTAEIHDSQKEGKVTILKNNLQASYDLQNILANLQAQIQTFEVTLQVSDPKDNVGDIP
ncbi:hypothetical protein SUGI_0939420 [Cryptomeria japonica]|nr:hypothetical protein SUGI_0939420 [Cryptomeria japonica]